MNPDQTNPTINRSSLKRWAVFAFLGIVAIITAYIIYIQIYSAKITLEFAPKSSVATLNGRRVRAGTIRVRPGAMNIRVEKDGFETQSKTFTAEGSHNTYVGIALLSNDPSTADWYDNNPEDNIILQAIYGTNYTDAAETGTKSLPLIERLPYFGAGYEYQIDYGIDPDESKKDTETIFITVYKPGGKEAALDWIRREGYDVSKLKIIYYDQVDGPQ